MEINDTQIAVQETKLLTHERDLLHELIHGSDQPQAIIPDDISTNKFWEYLTVMGKVAKGMDILDMRLRPLIGRMLVMAKKDPTLYRDHGYANYGDFIIGLKSIGLNHSTAYKAKQLAEDWPSLTLDRFQKIGTENMRTLSRFTKESNSDAEEHLEAAERLTTKELKRYAEERRLINKGEADYGVIEIETSGENAQIWKEFSTDARVHSRCGTTDAGTILVSAIQEVSPEWLDNRPKVASPEFGISDSATQDIIDSFVTDSRVHAASGTIDRNLNLAWGLAQALRLVSERKLNEGND